MCSVRSRYKPNDTIQLVRILVFEYVLVYFNPLGFSNHWWTTLIHVFCLGCCVVFLDVNNDSVVMYNVFFLIFNVWLISYNGNKF